MTSNGANGTNGKQKEENGNGDGSKNMGFFDAVLSPPDWLTESYIENVLRGYKEDGELKVTKFTISPCTKPGDNFVGVIFRSNVSYSSKGAQNEETYIVKIEPFLEGYKKEIMANQPFFNTEGRMYRDMLPVMQQLLNKSGDPEIIAPNLIHYSTDPNILIFQDVSPDGFVMRHMPVDFEKASVVAKKLGKFHALSYYLSKEENNAPGTSPSDFEKGFFCEELSMKFDFFKINLKALVQVTKEWALPESELLSEKISKLNEVFLEKMMDIYNPKTNEFAVLNHGDFHIRNLLFRYSDEENTTYDAIRFIDFQLSVYATPAIDLTYLLYMITDTEAREQNRDQLLAIYHTQFMATLKGLGFVGKAPSLLDIHGQQLKNGILEFFIATNFLTLFYMDHSKYAGVDFNDKEKMLDIVIEMYNGDVFKPLLKRILPQMMHKGLLDV